MTPMWEMKKRGTSKTKEWTPQAQILYADLQQSEKSNQYSVVKKCNL